MDYLKKFTKNEFSDMLWNVPEQKSGTVNVIGGNAQSFRAPVKTAEMLAGRFPINATNVVLPKSLESKVPKIEGFVFLPDTESGSFGDANALLKTMEAGDINLFAGDLSKNNITRDVICEATRQCTKTTILTRDAVDLVSEGMPERVLMNSANTFFASLPQLQKLFRAVYYPKVLTLSQSFIQVAEAIHKFTLSYPVGIITLNNDQVIVARDGNIYAVPLEKTTFTPMSFWLGEAAMKITGLNLYNPGNFLKASVAALF